MNLKGKHLSLEERKIIEDNIYKGLRKYETANELVTFSNYNLLSQLTTPILHKKDT